MGKRSHRTHAGLHRLHPTSKKANWDDRDKHRGFYIQISLSTEAQMLFESVQMNYIDTDTIV